VRRVTADSNIYISALNFGGKPLQVLELARAGQIELAISNAIITETSRILHHKFHWKPSDIEEAVRGSLTVPLQSSLDLASFTIEIRAARTSSGVLTGLANARRTGRGPCGVIADMSKPYRSTPVMLAEVTSAAFEKALQ